MRHVEMQGILVSAVLATMSSALVFAQSARSTPSSDGLELLTRVARKYADAKSYYVESVEERSSTGQYSHEWQKTVLTAAESPGGRYYYEGQSSTGSTLRVGNGQTVWTYRMNEHRYTVKPQAAKGSSKSNMIAMSESAMLQAEALRKELSALGKSLKSADRLPDVILKVDGHKVVCKVVRFQSSDQKRQSPRYLFDKTIWIDKNHETILNIVEHAHTYMMVPGGADLPLQEETTTTFTNTDLDGPVRDDLFKFVPPPDAKLIEDFPDPAKSLGSTMAGEQVPSLKLTSANGSTVNMDSFRGKAVLIDFWATWCAPCITSLPKIAQIYQETKGKGLIVISVDSDEEAKTAADFLTKKGYTWPNFHDDGEIEELIGSSGIPRAMLIDGGGKILYDGRDEDELRNEIAKLGPEYASLRSNPSQAPCRTSN